MFQSKTERLVQAFDIHGHTCSACGYTWIHGNPEACNSHVSSQAYKLAHTCAVCGFDERWKLDLAEMDVVPA